MSILSDLLSYLNPLIAPYSTSTPVPSQALIQAQANGLKLFNTLQPIVPTSPLQSNQDRELPEALYRKSNIGSTQWGGMETAHVSTFEVSVRAETYKELTSLVDQIDAAFQGVDGLDAVDSGDAYDDHRKAYRSDLEIEICTPIADVMVIEFSVETTDEGMWNCPQIRHDYSFAVIIHAKDYDAVEDLRDDIQMHIAAYQPTVPMGTVSKFKLASGEILPTAGGLFGWVDTYQLSVTSTS